MLTGAGMYCTSQKRYWHFIFYLETLKNEKKTLKKRLEKKLSNDVKVMSFNICDSDSDVSALYSYGLVGDWVNE